MAARSRKPTSRSKSGGKKPAGRKPAGRKPGGRKPAGKKPGGKKPGGKKPGGKRPGKKGPGAKRPAAKGRKRAATGKLGPGAKRLPPRRAIRVTPADATVESDGRMRLNRFIAGAGICSRRNAEELITAGRVEVNGAVVSKLATRVDPGADEVRVDGRRAQIESPVYVLFNKPKDVVCTNAKNDVRRRAIDFLDGVRGRIYTVGRLDLESEGLILLTNDGDFAQAVAHPRHGVPKTYSVLVKGRVERETLVKLRGGVWLSEGRTRGSEARIERQSRDRTYLKVTLREGKNREIRRVFARLGHNVLELKRVRIGRLTLHGLKPGGHRFLRPQEVRDLLSLASPE